MLKSLFKKKEVNFSMVAPITGKAIALEEVPDQVFSQKMMGDGIAIEPASHEVVSPIDGEVVDVFKTKHAISLRTGAGAEFLIHMGLETVNLNGDGFDIHVENGQKVKKGDKLASYDITKIAEMDYKVVTPIILLNGDDFEITSSAAGNEVTAGSDVLMEVNKK
ncbi:PTS sugar transporter subunit IIA [Saliterribacillus persicus]|uniref:PTS system IIA component (Glc family) n=1 Tax=Saliterribacillus persicus TaxID=930114 RepID=A0A368Y9I0_9BACI|nr:PTS glucose transporter subunit IIA [Saliterribacillus persicus]RCW74844.1 PTS system IIA component (Glc family) [Saliterribacillus persicus]